MRKLKDARRPEILDATLAVAAEDGLDKVSMRAVARLVGVTPMALYGYFRSKDELLDAVIGRVLEEVPLPPRDVEWRDTVRLLAGGIRAVASRHPSVFPLLLTRPAVSPVALTIIDVLYEALLQAGVPAQEIPRLERLFGTFLIGHALSEVNGRFSEGSLDTRSRRAQLDPDQLRGHQRLAAYLDAPVDWEAEFLADLEDLIQVVERAAARH